MNEIERIVSALKNQTEKWLKEAKKGTQSYSYCLGKLQGFELVLQVMTYYKEKELVG